MRILLDRLANDKLDERNGLGLSFTEFFHPLPPRFGRQHTWQGRHSLRFEFQTTGKLDFIKGTGAPGHGRLYIDTQLVGEGDIPLTMPVMIGLAGGMVCGADTGSPVWDKYQPPFEFTGTLYSTTVDLSGEMIKDRESEMRIALARQ